MVKKTILSSKTTTTLRVKLQFSDDVHKIHDMFKGEAIVFVIPFV